MPNLLIVDDRDDDRYLLRYSLETQGFTVVEANNGVEALAKARAEPPDLIISDIFMPAMDGFALCREWRADKLLRAIPFVFYTSNYNDPKDERLGLGLGANHYLRKPMEAPAMAELINQTLTGTGPPPDNPRPDPAQLLREHNEALQRKLDEILAGPHQERRDSTIQSERSQQSSSHILLSILEDQRQTEVALRESDARARAVSDFCPIGIFMADPKGQILYDNVAVRQVLGLADEEKLGDAWATAVHPGDRERVFAAWSQFVSGDQPDYDIEFRFVRPDATVRTVHARAGRIYEGERLLGFTGTAEDITERRQAETERTRLGRMIEASLNEIYVFDAESLHFEFVNRGARRNLGYSLEQLHAMTPLDLKPEFTEASFREMVGPLLRREQPLLKFYTNHRREDGSLYPVEVHLQWVEEAGDAVFVAMILDITERRHAEANLRERDVMLSSFFDSGGTLRGIVELLADDILHIADNQVSAAFFGRTVESMRSRRASEMGVPQETLRMWLDYYREAERLGRPRTFTYEHSDERGLRSLEVSVCHLGSIADEQSHFAYVANDITERNATAKALLDSKALYQSLVENLPQCVYRKDLAGRFTYVNGRFCELVDGTPEDILGRTDFDLFPRAAAEKYAHDDRAVIVDGRVVHQVEASPTLKPDGQFIEVIKSPLRNARDEIIGSQGIFWDVTERIAAQRRITELSNAVQQTADAVFITDREGRFTFVNPAFEELTGYPFSELAGQTPRVLKSGTMPKEFYQNLWRTILGGDDFRSTVINRKRNGELFHCDETITPLVDESGEIAGFVSTLRDITEQRQAEAALKRLNQRLLRVQDEERRRLARELHDSTAQTLAALTMNLAALLDGRSQLDSDTRQLVADSRKLAEQSAQEIRTLSYLLHPPLLDEFGLPQAIRDLTRGFTDRSHIPVELDLPEEWQRLPEESELVLFRILQESLANLHRHSDSATAQISLKRTNTETVLEVTDTGKGFPETGSGMEKTRTGVGVAGMRERLSHLGGHLEIESSPGGTTIRAIVPLVGGEEPQ